MESKNTSPIATAWSFVEQNIWTLSPVYVIILVLDTPLSPLRILSFPKRAALSVYLILYALVAFWTNLINKTVPEPYLVRLFEPFFEEYRQHDLGRSLSHTTSTGILRWTIRCLGSQAHHPSGPVGSPSNMLFRD